MEPVTVNDLKQLVEELAPFISGLLLSSGVSAFLLGFLGGFLINDYIRNKPSR